MALKKFFNNYDINIFKRLILIKFINLFVCKIVIIKSFMKTYFVIYFPLKLWPWVPLGRQSNPQYAQFGLRVMSLEAIPCSPVSGAYLSGSAANLTVFDTLCSDYNFDSQQQLEAREREEFRRVSRLTSC